MEIVVQNHAPSLVLSITVFGSNRVHSVGWYVEKKFPTMPIKLNLEDPVTLLPKA